MKVLNAEELHAGLKRNMEMLHRLEVEMQSIEKAMKELTQLEESLKGVGGNAIRSFYEECHVPFLQFFQLFSEQFNQVLQQMEAALYSLEPDSQGYILEQFLEGELEQGLTLMGRLTSNLTDETNSIMDQVNDIVGLPHLDDSGVQEGVIQSKRKRDDTVTQLYEFDATQTNALQPAEQDIQTMKTWLADLEGLFKNGLTDIHFQSTQWSALTSCNPLLTHLASFSEVDSMEVEDKETIIDTGIEVMKGAGTGLFDAGKDFVAGLWDTITNPKATVDGIVNAFSNPAATFNTIKTAISESYERDMVNGDANSRAHWVTYALGTVATSIVGTKGANALVKTGTTAAKASVPRVVSATNHASASLANLLPYTPRPQLAMAGGIPYNVVNGVQLKDQLITMAKAESGVSGATEKAVSKGTGKETYQHLKDYKNNKYFTRSVEYNAGKGGTGYTYKVYQRGDINWDMVRTKGAKKGHGLTNAEASANFGLAPILDDVGSVATLHHSQQKGVGPLYEASTRYHNISNAKRAPLHPYKGKLNPFYPMDEATRGAFQKVDSINYWKIRGEEALGGK